LPKLKELTAGASQETIRDEAGKNKAVAFYDGLLKTAEFFIVTMLPVAMGKMDSILSANKAVVDMHAESFG